MKFLAIAALTGAVVAHGPQSVKSKRQNMANLFQDIIETGAKQLAKRQAPGGGQPQPGPLIGDLVELGQGGSPVNDKIVACFRDQNGVGCEDKTPYQPPKKDTPQCEKDTCCIWSYIGADLASQMKEKDNTCNNFARSAVRFGFHDAGAWTQGASHGGADGSLLLDADEVKRPVNAGLETAYNVLAPMYQKYKKYGISAADFVQFAHNVAVTVCPMGPRSLTYVGRKDRDASKGPAPENLLPDANSPAEDLIALFAAKTITIVDLVALLGAHTSAKQFFFDVSQAGKPFDSTPGVWDVAFYSEILKEINGTEPVCGTFRLPSDKAIAQNQGGNFGFLNFGSDPIQGQTAWNGLYSRAYLRLSLLGVDKIQSLVDCTKALPIDTPSFVIPASARVTCPADGGNGGSGNGGSGNGNGNGNGNGGYGDGGDGSIKQPSACVSKSKVKVTQTATVYV